jgi:Putative bacterial sensory transduction regulator
MIAAWFEGHELTPTCHDDQHLSIDFPVEPLRCAARLHAMKEGAVLFVVSLLSRWFSSSDMPVLLPVCNLWNVSHKWPTAVVEPSEDDGTDRVDVRAENSLFVPSGCTQHQIDDFISEHLRSSLEFYGYLALELPATT